MARARCWLSLAAAVVMLAGCGGDALTYGGRDTRLSTAPTERTERKDEPPRASGGAIAPPVQKIGLVRFRVRDRRDDRPRGGIPVMYTHTASGKAVTVFTGAAGTADVRLARGRYDVRVVTGCAPTMVVRYGSSGTFGVAGGQTLTVPLEVESSYRFVASGPITWDTEPPWTPGETVDFRFRFVSDPDCGGSDARTRSLGPLRVKGTGKIDVVDVQPRSDSDAMVSVKIRCIAYGGGQLLLYDPTDETNETDLMRFRSGFAPGSWCSRP